MLQPFVPAPVVAPIVPLPQRPQEIRETAQTLRSAVSPNSESGKREAANERSNQGQDTGDAVRDRQGRGGTRGSLLDISV